MDLDKIKPSKDISTVGEMLRQEFCARFIDADSGKIRSELLQDQPCPLCGNSAAQILFAKDFLEYRQCGCGVVFISPNLKEEVRLEWYRTSKTYAWFWQEVVLKRRSSRIEEIWKPRISRLAQLGVSFDSVLDVGCGCGEFLELLSKEPGRKLQGVEPGMAASKIAQQYVGDLVRQGTLHDVSEQPNSFSLISFWEVFHHLPSPRHAISLVRKLLKPGGHMVFQSPNFSGFDYQLLGRHHHDVNFSIPFYLSPSPVQKMLEDEGFEPQAIAIITPGKLDVDYVLAAIAREGEGIITDPMWKMIFQRIARGDPKLKGEMQMMLQNLGLSGSMLVIAQNGTL